MTTSHNGNDYERLKEELRRLKRRGAPWYFESALHQRLHGGRKGRPRLRPISTTPVIVVAVITLCILALACYVFFVRTNLFPSSSLTRPAVSPDTLRRVGVSAPGAGTPRESHPRAGENPRPAPLTAPQFRRTADTALERVPEPVRDDTVGRPVRTFERADTAAGSVPPPAVHADTIARRSAVSAARRDTSSRAPDTTGHPSTVRPPR